MKKTYKQPEVLVVELGFKGNVMLSASDEKGSVIPDDGEGDGTDIGAKEFFGKSLWDNEW